MIRRPLVMSGSRADGTAGPRNQASQQQDRKSSREPGPGLHQVCVLVARGPASKPASSFLSGKDHRTGISVAVTCEVLAGWRVVEADPVDEQALERGDGKAAQCRGYRDEQQQQGPRALQGESELVGAERQADSEEDQRHLDKPGCLVLGRLGRVLGGPAGGPGDLQGPRDRGDLVSPCRRPDPRSDRPVVGASLLLGEEVAEGAAARRRPGAGPRALPREGKRRAQDRFPAPRPGGTATIPAG